MVNRTDATRQTTDVQSFRIRKFSRSTSRSSQQSAQLSANKKTIDNDDEEIVNVRDSS